MTELQEARLLGRAVRRWDVPLEEKAKTIERLCYLRDFGEKESTQIAAAKAIVDAEGQNQRDEHKFVDVRIQHGNARLASVADELGLDPGLIAEVEGGAGSIASSDEAEVG